MLLSRILQTVPPENLLDIVIVLKWLTGIGSAYVTGKVFAFIAENFAFWHKLPRLVKFYVPMIFSVGLVFLADLVLHYTELLSMIQPNWALAVGAIVIYLGTQVGYMDAKARGYAASARGRG